MKRISLQIMIVVLFSKCLGFVKEILLAYFFGASGVTDAYIISYTIPTTIFAFISNGVTIGFVPIYSRVFGEQGFGAANRYTNNVSNILLLMASVVVGVTLLATEPIVRLFASGFNAETMALAVGLTRISVFSVYFTAILVVFSNFVRIHGYYVIPAAVGLSMNVGIILAIVFSARSSPYLLGVGYVLAVASQVLLLLPVIRKTGYRYQRAFNVKDENVKTMLLMSLPVIAGTCINEINVVVDRTIASSIAVGGISALSYASRFNGFVSSVFIEPLSTVLYPMISKMVVEQDIRGLKTSVVEAITIVGLLSIPATAGMMVFSEEIVRALFGRGAFADEAVVMTSNALLFYSVGVVAFGLRGILARVFYAFQDTRMPMINASIAVSVNIVLNVVFSRYLGVGGLALATSVSGIISALLMWITLRKRIGLGTRTLGLSLVKIASSSLVMGLIARGSYHALVRYVHGHLPLILAVLVGGLTYTVLICCMKIPEVDRVIRLFRNKLLG